MAARRPGRGRTAARGRSSRLSRFDDIAASYSMRPDYPSEAIDWIVSESGAEAGEGALDVGAGTGQLASALAERGLAVSAAEPSDPMREVLSARLPDARIVPDRAEDLSFADGSFALAVAGQAYHWLEPAAALPQLHRVLRPGGAFAIAWILPDTSDPLQERIDGISWQVLRRSSPPGPMPGQPLLWDEWFEPAGSRTFAFRRTIPPGSLPRYVSSFAVVAALDPGERDRVIAESAGWVDPDAEVDLPYTAELHLGRRRG